MEKDIQTILNGNLILKQESNGLHLRWLKLSNDKKSLLFFNPKEEYLVVEKKRYIELSNILEIEVGSSSYKLASSNSQQINQSDSELEDVSALSLAIRLLVKKVDEDGNDTLNEHIEIYFLQKKTFRTWLIALHFLLGTGVIVVSERTTADNSKKDENFNEELQKRRLYEYTELRESLTDVFEIVMMKKLEKDYESLVKNGWVENQITELNVRKKVISALEKRIRNAKITLLDQHQQILSLFGQKLTLEQIIIELKKQNRVIQYEASLSKDQVVISKAKYIQLCRIAGTQPYPQSVIEAGKEEKQTKEVEREVESKENSQGRNNEVNIKQKKDQYTLKYLQGRSPLAPLTQPIQASPIVRKREQQIIVAGQGEDSEEDFQLTEDEEEEEDECGYQDDDEEIDIYERNVSTPSGSLYNGQSSRYPFITERRNKKNKNKNKNVMRRTLSNKENWILYDRMAEKDASQRGKNLAREIANVRDRRNTSQYNQYSDNQYGYDSNVDDEDQYEDDDVEDDEYTNRINRRDSQSQFNARKALADSESGYKTNTLTFHHLPFKTRHRILQDRQLEFKVNQQNNLERGIIKGFGKGRKSSQSPNPYLDERTKRGSYFQSPYRPSTYTGSKSKLAPFNRRQSSSRTRGRSPSQDNPTYTLRAQKSMLKDLELESEEY